MSKVGQIYRLTEDCGCFVITRIYNKEFNQVIYSDGRADIWDNDFVNRCIFIAEYPTWKEAINSKEFKGEK